MNPVAFNNSFNTTPCPCDSVLKTGSNKIIDKKCRNYDQCAKEELACRDFLAFINNGSLRDRDRNPSKSVYETIYPK
jgi:hypothetical protein